MALTSKKDSCHVEETRCDLPRRVHWIRPDRFRADGRHGPVGCARGSVVRCFVEAGEGEEGQEGQEGQEGHGCRLNR